MNKKPKRDQNPPALDFVTALTPPECVERLKESAFGTTSTHLTIRANERNFIVELPGIRYGQERSIFQCRGQFSADPRGTRVVGWVTETNKAYLTKNQAGSIFTIIIMLGLVFALYLAFEFGWVVGILAIATALVSGSAFFLMNNQGYQQSEKKKQDLARWVYRLLHKPPADQEDANR